METFRKVWYLVKNSDLVLLLTLLCTLIITPSCLAPWDAGFQSMASVEIRVQTVKNRTLFPNLEAQIHSMELLLTGPFGEEHFLHIDQSTQPQVQELRPGDWSIVAEAKNAMGQVILSQTKEQTLQKGPNLVEIALEPKTQGSGLLDLDVVFPVRSLVQRIEYRLFPLAEQPGQWISAPVSQNSIALQENLSSGEWVLDFRIFSGGEAIGGFSEIIWIFDNALTSHTKTIPLREIPAPLPPDDFAANLTDSGVILSWRDQSEMETGYALYRKAEGGSWQLLSTFLPGTQQYLDGNLDEETSYQYQIITRGYFEDSPPVQKEVLTGSNYQPQPQEITIFFHQPDDLLPILSSINCWGTWPIKIHSLVVGLNFQEWHLGGISLSSEAFVELLPGDHPTGPTTLKWEYQGEGPTERVQIPMEILAQLTTSTPQLDLAGGTYIGGRSIHASGEGQVYYTLDGSLPEEGSQTFPPGGLFLPAPAIHQLQVRALAPHKNWSSLVSVVYEMEERDDQFFLYVKADHPPTIWLWEEGGRAISDLESYEYPGPTMNGDFGGYYVFQVPSDYLPLEAPLNVKINDGEIATEILSQTSWWDGSSWLQEDPRDNSVFYPYIGPYLSLIVPETLAPHGTPTTLNPATHMVVHYEINNVDDDFTGAVYYRTLGSGNWTIQSEDDYPEIAAGMGRVHHTTLSGLTPDTTYEYRVLGPAGSLSPVYTFRTASPEQNYSRFLVIGDMQDQEGDQRWSDVAEEITTNHLGKFDFIITVGDMVKDDHPRNGDPFYWWKVFFEKGRNLFASKAMMPALGNHDTPENPFMGEPMYASNAEDTLSFRKYFYLDPDMSLADYYGFSYGNASFLSVNSEIPVYYGRFPERDFHGKQANQNQWLRDSLESLQSQDWNFAYHHVPVINPAGGKDEVSFVRPLADIFAEKLDWNITGHVHEYQRLRPVYATATALDFQVEGYGRSAGLGTGYMISAPAGQWPRANSTPGMDEMLAAYPHNQSGDIGYEIGFTIVHTQERAFEMWTYGMGGVEDQSQPSGYRVGEYRTTLLIDHLSYTKTGLVADAGPAQFATPGETVVFDATGSSALWSSITSWNWDFAMAGETPSRIFQETGTYLVGLRISDDLNQEAHDTTAVFVQDEHTYQQEFSGVDFRGSSNGWGQTPMTLVADHTWRIELFLPEDETEAGFKFFANDKWYGDDEGDGETHSNEQENIPLAQGTGYYSITLVDNQRAYTVEKFADSQ